jgi:hypothetical protein
LEVVLLKGKFHSHITLPDCYIQRAKNLINGKVTPIDLVKEGVVLQKDSMLTHYFVTGYKGYDTMKESLLEKTKLLEDKGLPVLRLKIEHEILDPMTPPEEVGVSLSQCQYVEIHARFSKQTQGLDSTWAVSFNELDPKGDTFYTKRFFGEDTSKGLDAYNKVKTLKPLELKIETVLYDSNPALDEDWAS